MSFTIPACSKALLDQANERAPHRNKASDGTLGDARHQKTKSYHNPDGRGVVRARDLTHDPANGMDAHAWIRQVVARNDPRVMEAISNGQIWTRKRAAEGWRTYTGASPHTKHAHITFTLEGENDTSPWWPDEPTPKPTPVKEARMLGRIHGRPATGVPQGTPVKDGKVDEGAVFELVGRGLLWVTADSAAARGIKGEDVPVFVYGEKHFAALPIFQQ